MPLMAAAWSEARNGTAAATSSGCMFRPRGDWAARPAKNWLTSVSPASPARPGVSVEPGLTAFTRMPRSLSSWSQLRAKLRAAALVAAYTLRPAPPFWPSTEAARMIDAPSTRRGRVDGEGKPLHVDGQGAVDVLFGDLRQGNGFADRGVGEEHVDASSFLTDARVERVEVVKLGHVRPDRDGVAAELFDGLIEFCLAASDDDDVRALGDEAGRGGQPDSGGAAGDHGDLVLE